MPVVCVTCGAQYPADASSNPECCIICEDERQYVVSGGQRWIGREELCSSHKNVLRDEEASVLGIGTEPSFAIGQRALLIQTGVSLTPSSYSAPNYAKQCSTVGRAQQSPVSLSSTETALTGRKMTL